jgi:hypothetical protein
MRPYAPNVSAGVVTQQWRAHEARELEGKARGQQERIRKLEVLVSEALSFDY